MPRSSTKFLAGDIYLVRFHPGYGSELHKYRPAVIVSSVVGAIDDRFTLIAPLTTNNKILHPSSEMLIQSNPCLEQDSVLLCWYLWTIDASRLIRRLGKLNQNDLEIMRRQISNLFF
jgi:mRNA interferase MazF